MMHWGRKFKILYTNQTLPLASSYAQQSNKNIGHELDGQPN